MTLGGPVPDPDFFVSHADADLTWAEWIAAELEAAGYGVIVKDWDFLPGENRLTRLDEALATCKHTLCVLSQAYLDSEAAARTAAHYQDLQGKERALIPVQIAACTVPPLMAPIIAIDLADVDTEDEARHRLLTGVAGRAEQVARGGFPRSRAAQVRFPKTPQEVWDLRGHRADPHFIGRDDVLSALHRDLRAGRPTSGIQAITGLGGQGKTGLVVEYAHRYAGAYDLAWWIRAEDPATLRGDYVELAAELGLPAEKDDQAIAALRRELRRRRNWLLIFDNAEDPDELFPLLPDKHSGHVLVTSRRREWPHAETRHLDVLSAAAAAEYLQRRGRVADRNVAGDIADALGCLPLALVQAASVLAEGMRASDYLNLLRQQSPELFTHGHTPDRDETIATTWRVSVDRLAQRSEAALALFRLAAFLGADAIPLTRLTVTELMPPELAAALADPFPLTQATAALGEYSLAETADGLLSIHRLVQAVTRAELGNEAPHWAEIALATIATAFPDNEQDPKAWEACEEVLAHALTCAGHAVELQIDPIATVRLLDRVARYLLARGRIDSADAALKQAFAAAEPLDDKDPAYLSCRKTYGQLLFAQGDYPAARAVQEETYGARVQGMGQDDPDTLRAGLDLVQTLHAQGHRVQAAELHDRLVEAFTAILGPDDLETITAQAYLATILRDAGRYARARVIEEHVAEVRTRLLGEEHPDTLLAKANLAVTLDNLGETEQARVIGEQVVEARVRILGEQHPDTLRAKDNLAAVLRDLGALEQARGMAEQVVETRSRILGEAHAQTLEAMALLATILAAQGGNKEAVSLLTSGLAIAFRAFGQKHAVTTEAAWRLVESCGPHQAARQRALIIQYLSWLTREPSDHLTGSQKQIKEKLRGGKQRPASARSKNKKKRG